MLRSALIAAAILASAPAFAFSTDFSLPHLTWPDAPVTTTSTANGK